MYIIGNGWGDASQAGLCLAGMSVGAIIGGLVFNRMLGLMNKWFMFAALLIFALSYLLFIFADGLTLLAIGGIFAGFGNATVLPYYLGKTAQKCIPEQADLAYGFVTTGINIGAVLCPFVQALIGSIIGSSDLRMLSLISFVVIIIAAVCSLAYLKNGRKDMSK